MFELKINTGNAAFEEEPRQEVIRILQEAILKLIEGNNNNNLFDINGNRVGHYIFKEEYREVRP